MGIKATRKAARERQARYRERLKERGLVPLTVMVRKEYIPRLKQIVKELNAYEASES
jgi:hypothetical protein